MVRSTVSDLVGSADRLRRLRLFLVLAPLHQWQPAYCSVAWSCPRRASRYEWI